MSKLSKACLVVGIVMVLTIVVAQIIKPQAALLGWENVSEDMSKTLESLKNIVPEAETETKPEPEPDSEPESQLNFPELDPESPITINLNTATIEQLDTLPGIGPSKAKAIIDYRAKYGEFHTLEQIMEVKGIGPKMFEKMKVLISISEM